MLVVQKFGGSSLADLEAIRRIAVRVQETRAAGHRVVVVVSAMGDTTDRLLGMVQAVSSFAERRSVDLLLASGEQACCALLSIAIEGLGGGATALTGPQAGLQTDDRHGCADITGVDPTRVLKELAENRVVVVAGFQGLSPTGEITTLGRGGSDTTAVALAAALGAERCEIYSDVEGVFAADPRLVPDAELLPALSYEEMVTLAHHGAKVLHPRAVELAARHRVSLWIGSSFSAGLGTRVGGSRSPRPGFPVGVTGCGGLVRLSPRSPRRPAQVLDRVLEELPQDAVLTELATTQPLLVRKTGLLDAQHWVQKLRRDLDEEIEVTEGLGSVVVVGLGLHRTHRAFRRLNGSLRRLGIRSVQKITGDHMVGALVHEEHMISALKVSHERFLARPRIGTVPPVRRPVAAFAADVALG